MARERRVRGSGVQAVVVVVRTAVEADLPRVAEIKVANWADTYAPLLPPAVLASFLDLDVQLAYLRKAVGVPSTLLLVAEDASRAVVGFALTHLDQGPDPWLESLHVIRASRGGGTGTALMRATAAELLDRGYRTMRLGVVQGNAAAARFYDRLGAALTGVEPALWADGVWHEIYRWDDITQLA
ncbi:MAG TPA: GNAT family N-acetyltransferase [Candidatus Dormibacteraeota bacterium]|nr:GNAT family N-acetyltransferase [Candidatus Dormibacteraeota bacterium]